MVLKPSLDIFTSIIPLPFTLCSLFAPLPRDSACRCIISIFITTNAVKIISFSLMVFSPLVFVFHPTMSSYVASSFRRIMAFRLLFLNKAHRFFKGQSCCLPFLEISRLANFFPRGVKSNGFGLHISL